MIQWCSFIGVPMISYDIKKTGIISEREGF